MIQRSVIGPVLQEIEESSLAFQEFLFSFIPSNNVAHILARQVSNTHIS
jgi:hypothetical protein